MNPPPRTLQNQRLAKSEALAQDQADIEDRRVSQHAFGEVLLSPRRPVVFDSNAINHAAFSYYVPLQRLLDFVVEHLDDPLPVRLAARIVGMNEKYLSTFFRQKVGVCYRDWLCHLRVERAIGLMRARDNSITDISAQSGFGDLRTFERAFKRHTGQTPREFKKRIRPC